ncbi:MAG: hypothetical protein JETT_0012 [Candidatus Jettenia ecosi]|uniref:Uncharacterized protein n=1 Tax=Candidatus Jettenia ecosi TaxID=2494326 RepID=A0A533QLA3_9BACT|nr:MAG: hypothetical protein JETT_0012 [Candidatus Jettenia ecosi]
MGDEEIKAAVADAGPLIHLSEIGGIAILHIFDVVHVFRMPYGWKLVNTVKTYQKRYTLPTTIYQNCKFPNSHIKKN